MCNAFLLTERERREVKAHRNMERENIQTACPAHAVEADESELRTFSATSFSALVQLVGERKKKHNSTL